LKNGCDQRAIPVEMAEDLIEAHWETVTLTEKKCEEIRQVILEYVEAMLPLFHGKTEEAKRQLARLDGASQKVLQAHCADAIPVEVLKEEQASIALAKATAQNILERYTADEVRIKQQLTYWVGLMHQAFRHYRAGNPAVRRQLNQGAFEQIWLDDDAVAGFDYTPAFRRMLADTLPADLAAEQAREQKRLVRTRDLWLVPDPEPVLTKEDLTVPKDLTRRDRRHTVRAPLSAYLRQERPTAICLGERKNPGPSQDRRLTIISW
jgi:predicted metal-dependent hydrolase